MECVRGHRSSSCKHHERPLLQVRSKGRPGVYANGNPNHRVAIFAEEIAKSDKPSTNGTKRCKSEPIIVLKASSKQVIDCSSGVIIGPYDETKQNPAQSKRGPPAAHNKRRKFYQYICVLYAQNIKRKIMWMLQQ